MDCSKYRDTRSKEVPTLPGAECDNHHDRRAVFSIIVQHDTPRGVELVEFCAECKNEYEISRLAIDNDGDLPSTDLTTCKFKKDAVVTTLFKNIGNGFYIVLNPESFTLAHNDYYKTKAWRDWPAGVGMPECYPPSAQMLPGLVCFSHELKHPGVIIVNVVPLMLATIAIAEFQEER